MSDKSDNNKNDNNMEAYASMLQLGGALIAARQRRAIEKANQSVRTARTEAENTIRSAKNVREASRATLSRALQSINNARYVRGRESAIARAQGASIRENSAAAAGALEARLRASEEAGATQAEAAFSGVSGGFLDTALATAALRDQRQQQRAAADSSTRFMQDAQGIGDQQGLILAGQDMTRINPGFDLTTSGTAYKPYSPSSATQVLTKALDKDLLRPLVQWGASFFAPRKPGQPFDESSIYGNH